MRVGLSDGRGISTQAQVALDAGITQGYYSMIESGQRTPSVSLARRLGAVLKVDWHRFYEEEDTLETDKHAKDRCGQDGHEGTYPDRRALAGGTQSV